MIADEPARRLAPATVLTRKMHRLGGISPKVLIFRAIRSRFKLTLFSQSRTGHGWLHALVGCPSPVPGTAVSTVNDRHAKAIVDMPARSDCLVFSGSQTCGILLS